MALFDGNFFGSSGRVIVYASGGINKICTSGFTMTAAHAICQSNNFAGALAFTAGRAYGMPVPPTKHGISSPWCTGYETSVTQCPNFRFNGKVYCLYSFIGIDCSSTYLILNFIVKTSRINNFIDSKQIS